MATRRLQRTLLHPGAMCVAAALSVIVPLLDADWRAASHHGFFHHAVVYQIFEHGVPPENPLFAGEPLRYYYGLHLLLAAVMRVVPLAPQWLFAFVNVGAVVVFILAVDQLARYIDRDPVVRACACLLALTGLDPLTRGWVAAGVKSMGWPIERRAFPWHKFMTVNAGQVGAVIAALALLLLVRFLGRRPARWELVAFAGLTASAAWVYPYAWVVIVGWVGVAAFERLVRRRPFEAAAALGAGVVVGSILAAPYLRALASGRASELQQAKGITVFLRHGAVLLPMLGIAGILVLAGRREMRSSWRRNAELAPLLLAWGFAAAGLFFAARLFDRTEYKFLLFSMTPFAVLLAPALRSALRTRPLLGVVLVGVLVWPIATKSAQALAWRASDPASSAGRYLRAARADENALCEWILASTPPEATFIDLRRTIPVFARRSLFVALDEPAVTLHAVTGAPLAAVERRRALAKALIGEGDASVGDVGARLRQETAGRPLYVVARTAEARGRLMEIGDFERVYAAESAAVFALR
jgi:hypothetical protein